MLYSHPEGNVFYRKMGHSRPKISHGAGIYLYDEMGNRYLDGSGGPLVVNVGHGREQIIKAMNKQLEKVAYVHAIMFTSEVLEDYAQQLSSIVPLEKPRFYFLSSGSEVVEAAIKLSRQIQMARGEHGRNIVISRSLSYHGMTLGALGVSGRPGLRAPYLGMLHNMPHIRHPYPYRFPATGEELADRLEESILAYGPSNVAAFIAEPISGATLGAAEPPDDYWWRIRHICDKYQVLLIADEVLVGMGRTGKWWALQHWDVIPDILVTSKGAAGGYFPLGFVAAKGSDVELIRQEMGDFNHGGTFSHHAVGAAAGLATLNIIRSENLVGNAERMGRFLGESLHRCLNHHRHVGDIRGRGLFWGIELVKDRRSTEPFPAGENIAWRIWKKAFELGLVIYYSQGCADGVNGDILMIGPPLIINKEQIDELVGKLNEAVRIELGE
ncbi:MAG: aminotransferase class III-fold pyridoxal phosphate-dependent enzyme [Candidatus Promineifilaceae bacterium]|nr:aminotransferase class III-fold pyridoxal phosphate-dependent enzyme [Candidatus Promineifilaceae bacterium]